MGAADVAHVLFCLCPIIDHVSPFRALPVFYFHQKLDDALYDAMLRFFFCSGKDIWGGRVCGAFGLSALRGLREVGWVGWVGCRVGWSALLILGGALNEQVWRALVGTERVAGLACMSV